MYKAFCCCYCLLSSQTSGQQAGRERRPLQLCRHEITVKRLLWISEKPLEFWRIVEMLKTVDLLNWILTYKMILSLRDTEEECRGVNVKYSHWLMYLSTWSQVVSESSDIFRMETFSGWSGLLGMKWVLCFYSANCRCKEWRKRKDYLLKWFKTSDPKIEFSHLSLCLASVCSLWSVWSVCCMYLIRLFLLPVHNKVLWSHFLNSVDKIVWENVKNTLFFRKII